MQARSEILKIQRVLRELPFSITRARVQARSEILEIQRVLREPDGDHGRQTAATGSGHFPTGQWPECCKMGFSQNGSRRQADGRQTAATGSM